MLKERSLGRRDCNLSMRKLCVYICVYIYVHIAYSCELMIWAKFGQLEGIIGAKFVLKKLCLSRNTINIGVSTHLKKR